LLSDALADQIAAGEVVERPGSVVKELIENSVDAGATRVELRLEEGGRKLMSVVDDGRGIPPGELELALTRHATSKLKRADQLVELLTLGFRGEALASIAAVARVTMRSRQEGASGGTELRSVPGEVREVRPCAMALGTQVRVEELFSALPARRKFLRSEATEVGHCVEAVLRTALVHPQVHFLVQHGGRQLLSLPKGNLSERVAQVLGRRGEGPYFEIEDEVDGVWVQAWLAPPEQASRQRGGLFVVVRRRVVSERSLQGIVAKCYGDLLEKGRHPVACLIVEPAHGSVDVNVHPQKSEVRFSEPQRVYGAVRHVLSRGVREAPWWRGPAEVDEGATGRDSFSAGRESGVASALDHWDESRPSLSAGRPFERKERPGNTRSGYRLGTRAVAGDYGEHKRSIRGEMQDLETRLGAQQAGPSRAWLSEEDAAPPAHAIEASGPSYLTCLRDGVALYVLDGELWAADLRRLRTFLLTRRLHAEFGGAGVQAQGLLPPLTVTLPRERVALIGTSRDRLLRVGVDAEAFGDDSVIVRAVPAALDGCTDVAGVEALLVRLTPWLRMQENADLKTRRVALDAVAGGEQAVDPEIAARYARRWLKQCLELEALEKLPGVRRWPAAALMRGR
jgi:DNA mismatch repair protein MutL